MIYRGEYVRRQRIEAFFTGELRVRKIGTPIMVPSGNEKWSKIPEEWKV
jgi:hypothetical protein